MHTKIFEIYQEMRERQPLAQFLTAPVRDLSGAQEVLVDANIEDQPSQDCDS